MSVCRVCGGHTNTSRYNKVSRSYEPICDDCYEKEHFAEVEKRGNETKRADDFKEWDYGDFADLFWLHLGKYVKYPKWCKLDLYELNTMSKAR